MLITREEVLQGRDVEFPLTPQLEGNLVKLLEGLNKFRILYGQPMFVSSGYRPATANAAARGASKSAHLTCEACDFHDSSGIIGRFILGNQIVLEKCGLYAENPKVTIGWCHLTTRSPGSGNRIFNP